MKTLTVSVADDLYHRASQKATALDTSLRDVVHDLLTQWTVTAVSESGSGEADQRRTEFLRFLDKLDARPLQPGPSVGQVNREELYERAPGTGKDERAALVARLEVLFQEADARDRDKTGSAGPFSREELYAERLNRFR